MSEKPIVVETGTYKQGNGEYCAFLRVPNIPDEKYAINLAKNLGEAINTEEEPNDDRETRQLL